MSRRLFFGLRPTSDERRGLDDLWSGVLRGVRGRRVHRENLHLTLVFLGAVRDEVVEPLIAAADSITGRPFEVTLDRIEHRRRSAILWYGASSTPPALGELVEDLQARMAPLGFAPEKRTYRPHVTLARKVGRGAQFEQPADARVLRFSDFFLMESLPLPAPPRYREVRRFALGESGGDLQQQRRDVR